MSFHLDYEGYSDVDLRELGAYRYASHPSTEILMLSISHDGDGPYLWINPKYGKARTQEKALRLMKAMVDSEEEVWAHNFPFEFAVTRYRWEKDTGLSMPKNLLYRGRCTMAICRRCALPPGLGDVADLLDLPQKKDVRGKQLIDLLCKPHPKTGLRRMPQDHPLEFAEFGEYNVQDVRTEQALKERLTPFALTGPLLRSFQFDLQMNDMGIPVNVPALRNAQILIDEVMADVGENFRTLTGLNPTQRQKVKDLLMSHGLDLPDMTADTIDAAVERKDVPRMAKIILDMYSIIQYAAVKKVTSMLNVACDDGWIRGCLLWYGAGTGRWSGKLVQPHNFKRPTVKDTDLAYRMIIAGRPREEFDLLWGNALDVLSSCIRNFFHPPEGVFDADYNAIEARIVCWLAGQEDVLQMYRDGTDLYKWMAAEVYDRPIESIINPSDERELGKRIILGCGFNMGWEKFQFTCKKQYGISVSDAMAQRGVAMYRERCDRVTDLWKKVENAAKAAISRPGHMFEAGKLLRFVVKEVSGVPFMFMKLPSGRSILYAYPQLETVNSQWGKKTVITFYGGGDKGWGRQSTYGGKLVENATQGTAADIMAHGAANAVDIGFPVFLLVHDQALALRKPGLTLEDYITALTDLPSWADGLPIKAEGKIAPYYRK